MDNVDSWRSVLNGNGYAHVIEGADTRCLSQPIIFIIAMFIDKHRYGIAIWPRMELSAGSIPRRLYTFASGTSLKHQVWRKRSKNRSLFAVLFSNWTSNAQMLAEPVYIGFFEPIGH